VVTISPFNIIPAILLLFTRRPLAAGLGFLVGFVMGVAGYSPGADRLVEEQADRSTPAAARRRRWHRADGTGQMAQGIVGARLPRSGPRPFLAPVNVGATTYPGHHAYRKLR